MMIFVFNLQLYKIGSFRFTCTKNVENSVKRCGNLQKESRVLIRPISQRLLRLNFGKYENFRLCSMPSKKMI